MSSFKKNNFNLRRDHKKKSYERRDYESVDEWSLYYIGYVRKMMKKRIQYEKGYPNV